MIKKLIKIISFTVLLAVLIITYLSLVGFKTEKFNEKIANKVSKINKKIKLDLRGVKFLLDPYNFTVNIITKDSTVLLEDNKLEIKEIKTNISLKSLISKEFSVDDLEFSTKLTLEFTTPLKHFKIKFLLILIDRLVHIYLLY